MKELKRYGKVKVVKRRRLKKWVKVVLTILFILAIDLLLIKACENYENKAKECDNYYGYTCSTYMVDQYNKGIRHEFLRK